MKINLDDKTPRVLNYSAVPQAQLEISANDIPTLVPESKLKEWMKGDEEPFFKLQKIEYPIVANGLTYPESFFESFLNKATQRPIPGSKSGHSFFSGERPPTDFILVGGKLEKTGNGKGFVYFKNYIPKIDNEKFIVECKSDMVHFSLVTLPKYVRSENEDGTETIELIESMGGERNDAVEYGTGAMKQITNIENAGVPGDQISNGGSTMNKNEILAAIPGAGITLNECAERLANADLVCTLEDRKILNALKEKKIADPVKMITDLETEKAANIESVRNAMLDNAFGKDIKEDVNCLRQYAGKMIKGVTNSDITKEIEDLKKDPIALKLSAERADFSEGEIIGEVIKNGNAEQPSGDSVKTVKL
jgi:hypothetical protein